MIRKVILDTDLGSDVDDVGALALANIFHNQKKINLLAVTHTTSGLYGPLVCEAINEFYGNEDIPVGVYKGKEFLKKELVNNYPIPTSKVFPHKHSNVKKMPDALEVLKKTLKNNDHVTMIFIGQLLNLANLLKSEGGEELINQKVDAIYIMGGAFSEITGLPRSGQPEYNLCTALEESIYVIRRLKVKTVFIDGSIGLKVLTGARICQVYGDSHIVSYAYSRYIYREKDNSRFSWDLITVYQGCLQDDYFNEVGPGIVNIDEKGNTSFENDDKGNFYIVIANKSFEEIKERLETLLTEEVAYD